jgi:gamma-glutamylcyclotransferase (GGCT)/AIG2-like uncharacterized protein YtfP
MRISSIKPSYYFSYGHLTDPDEMAKLAPDAEFVGVGHLDDFTLTFRYFADIVNQHGARVYGTLWKIAHHDFATLDSHEALHKNYDRIPLEVHTDNGPVDAMVYIMEPERFEIQPPHKKYLHSIMNGYIKHGVPLSQLSDALDHVNNSLG